MFHKICQNLHIKQLFYFYFYFFLKVRYCFSKLPTPFSPTILNNDMLLAVFWLANWFVNVLMSYPGHLSGLNCQCLAMIQHCWWYNTAMLCQSHPQWVVLPIYYKHHCFSKLPIPKQFDHVTSWQVTCFMHPTVNEISRDIIWYTNKYCIQINKIYKQGLNTLLTKGILLGHAAKDS